MAVKVTVDTGNQTTVRVGQQNAKQVTSTQTGITYAANAGTAFNVVGGISSVTQLSVSGISTLGIVTAIRYYGDGSNLTGTGNTTNVSTNSLVVLGISTLGITSFNDDVLFKGATRNIKWNASQNDLEIGEDARLKFNNELDIWHGGTHGFIKNYGGDLRIRGDKILLKRENDEEKYLVAQVQDGRREVLLYYNNDLKFGTTGIGVTVYGNTETQTLNVTGVSTFNDNVELPDNTELRFGTHEDLKIYHTTASGGYSVISEAGTGQLIIGGNLIEFKNEALNQSYATIDSTGIDVTGHTETDTLNVSGVSTFAGDLTISSTFPRIYLTDTNSDSDFSIFNGNGTFTIKDETNATNRIRLFSGGGVQIDGNLDATAGLDVTGHTETDTLNVSGVSTFGGNINANGNIVGDTATNISGINSVTATSFYGDGSGLDNTGATLSAASGTQRLVLTSLTSGTMVSAATDGDLTFQSSSNLLSAGKLLVAGISTFNGNINANGNIVGDNATNITGIAGVTASTLTGTLQTAAQPNITSLGTLTSLDVTGNVSIGGTLTYDDVTNVDSLGIITARQGIHVLAGAGVSIAAGGLNVSSGVSTFVGNVGIGTTNIDGAADSNNTTILNAGIVTAVKYYGDAKYLSNATWDEIDPASSAGLYNFRAGEFAAPTLGNMGNYAAQNIAIGHSALGSINVAYDNVIIGHESGYFVTGSNNTFIGSKSGKNSTSGSNNTIIGHDLNLPDIAGSNQFVIGNSTINIVGANSNIGIGTTNPQSKLDVVGTLSVSDLSTYIGVATYKDDVFIDGTLTAGAIDGGTY